MIESIKSTKIRIGDISISYLIKRATTTETNTVIFIHGFPFNKNMWKHQLEALPPSTTGIAIDVRGHGNTTSGHGYFSIDVFAKDLGVFIKKLQLENVVLCGISMGGYISLRAYELFGEQLKGLILADTHSKADDNAAKQKRFDSIQAILLHGKRPFSIGFVENIFSKRTIESNQEALELIKSSIRRNSIDTICATQLALASRTDTTHVLSTISVPTLLIRGAEDKLTSEEVMTQLHQEIKGSVFEQIENCGHLPNLEAPEKFNALVSDLLNRIASN